MVWVLKYQKIILMGDLTRRLKVAFQQTVERY
jgi:hypothetical protein